MDQLGQEIGAPLDIVVPTGAMGNITAGYMAKKMGLPVRRLVAGVNANDITHRTFTKGEFHRSDRMVKTLSDAINIQVPYNMERIFYYLADEDASIVAGWMAEIREVFASRRVDDTRMCAAVRRAVDEHGYLP